MAVLDYWRARAERAEGVSDMSRELAQAWEERDYWQHRCMMEEKAKEAAFTAAKEFEKAALEVGRARDGFRFRVSIGTRR